MIHSQSEQICDNINETMIVINHITLHDKNSVHKMNNNHTHVTDYTSKDNNHPHVTDYTSKDNNKIITMNSTIKDLFTFCNMINIEKIASVKFGIQFVEKTKEGYWNEKNILLFRIGGSITLREIIYITDDVLQKSIENIIKEFFSYLLKLEDYESINIEIKDISPKKRFYFF